MKQFLWTRRRPKNFGALGAFTQVFAQVFPTTGPIQQILQKINSSVAEIDYNENNLSDFGCCKVWVQSKREGSLYAYLYGTSNSPTTVSNGSPGLKVSKVPENESSASVSSIGIVTLVAFKLIPVALSFTDASILKFMVLEPL